jgi:hypothetical protein
MKWRNVLIQSATAVILCCVLFSCNEAKFKNPCDLKSDGYEKVFIYKSAIKDYTSYCGVNFFNAFNSSSYNSAPSNFSYPSVSATYANGATISLTPTFTGSGLAFAINPSLPSGLSFDTSTGVISGSYTSHAGSTGSYTISVTNNAGTANYTLTLILFGKAPLQTGITQCYTGTTSSTTSCSGTAQDGEYKAGISSSFTGPTLVGATDYITTDNNTGLVWKTCNEGKSGSTCATGSISSINWATANTNCSSLNSGSGYGNRTDWRLPTAEEYGTILSFVGTNPATFSTYFPASSGGGNWSSTTDAANSSNAWYISFTDGTYGSTTKTNNNDVRCVAGTNYRSALFNDNNDGTITDINTGLVWQKCSQGLSGTNCTSGTASMNNWPNSVTSCDSLSLNSRKWRLPSVNELRTLLNFSAATSPTINATYFPATVSGSYWSSTSYGGGATSAWTVNFPVSGNCVITNLKTTATFFYRCVATGP